MWLLCVALLCARVQAEAECSSAVLTTANASITSSGRQVAAKLPRPPHALADIVGLDAAKAVLQEALVLPLQMADDMARLFGRSGERSAVLLAGPGGLGKRAAAEAAAAAAGALVLNLHASEAAEIQFCRIAMAAAGNEQPVVVIVESLETSPAVAISIRSCLRETVSALGHVPKLSIVATANANSAKFLSPSEQLVFGYSVELAPPSQVERKQFLLKLLAQVSRLDASWGSALRESAVDTLANLTEQYTFTEIDFVVRRAFLRSSSPEGARDPVALHHFEKILAETPPKSVKAFKVGAPLRPTALTMAAPSGTDEAASDAGEEGSEQGDSKSKKKKKKDGKDPMGSIFGWCNFWLPEPLHLPPVVWAMIIFGVLAHLMARTTYQPQNNRRRRGGPGGRSSLFGDTGMGEQNPYPSFGDNLGDWPLGGNNPFSNFPPAPGVPGLSARGSGSMGASSTGSGAASAEGSSAPSASSAAAKSQ